MDFLGTLLIGALGGALLWEMVRHLWSRRWRDTSIRTILRLLGAGVEFVYPDWATAKQDVISELQGASSVKILNLRGRSLVDGDFIFLLRQDCSRTIQVLLADPDAPNEHNPVALRARELQKGKPDLRPEVHLMEARLVLQQFYGHNLNEGCTLKVYQFPAVFRVFSSEKKMFLSFYPPDTGARDSEILRLPLDSPLFSMISRYFECTWCDPRSREPIWHKLDRLG